MQEKRIIFSPTHFCFPNPSLQPFPLCATVRAEAALNNGYFKINHEGYKHQSKSHLPIFSSSQPCPLCAAVRAELELNNGFF